MAQRRTVLQLAIQKYSMVSNMEIEMRAQSDRKDHPLSMRLPEADIAIIDRAASLRGRSRTEFMRDAAVRAAEEVILENRGVRMSEEGFQAFLDAISGPATAVPEIVEILARPAPWDDSEQSA